MNNLNYAIIGGGLTGSLTAINIKGKIKHSKIEIFESTNNLFQSFSSINIDKYKINNGFHAIEMPRANQMVDILSKVGGINLIKTHNRRAIIVEGEIIESNSNLDNWPLSLKDNFRKKPIFGSIDKLCNNISNHYLELIISVSKRYGDDFNSTKHLFIPWFLPNNYFLNSEDEGDVFRRKYQSSGIDIFNLIPKNSLFEHLGEPIKNYLQENNIKINFNSRFRIDPITHRIQNAVDFDIKKFDKIFFCTSPISILKDLDISLFKSLLKEQKCIYNALIKLTNFKISKYSEILIMDSQDISISRISFPNISKNKDELFIQIEIFDEPQRENEIKKRLIKSVSRILKVNDISKIELLGIVNSRKIFFPKQKDLEKGLIRINKWNKENEYNFIFSQSFGPVNMSKAGIIANKNLEYCYE